MRGGGGGGVGERSVILCFSTILLFSNSDVSVANSQRGKGSWKNGVICQISMLSSMHLKVIESKHLEVTKSPYYLLCLEWSQKKVSAHGLMWEIKIPRNNLKYQRRENCKTTREIYQSKKLLKLIPVKITGFKLFFVIIL